MRIASSAADSVRILTMNPPQETYQAIQDIGAPWCSVTGVTRKLHPSVSESQNPHGPGSDKFSTPTGVTASYDPRLRCFSENLGPGSVRQQRRGKLIQMVVPKGPSRREARGARGLFLGRPAR